MFIAQLSPLSSPAVFTEGQTDWPRAEIHLLLFSLCGFFFLRELREWRSGKGVSVALSAAAFDCVVPLLGLSVSSWFFFSNSEPFPISKTFCFLYDWKLRMISPVV